MDIPMPAPELDIVAPVRALMTDSPSQILEFAAKALDRGVGAALITLVEIRGGSARALGSQMAVGGDGTFCGFVSGGCTEAAVATEAMNAIRKGCDRLLHLGEGSDFFDVVLPCGGGITLAIHIIRDDRTIRQVAGELQDRRRSALLYDPGGQRLEAISVVNQTGWQNERFAIRYRPPPRLLLFGRSIELETTMRVARAAGYDTRSFDGIEARSFASETIDRDTAIVLLHHDVDLEIPVLKESLLREPFYIGALGSARTHARRSNLLSALGIAKEDIARIRAPIGIFGKARDASALALSVVAEIAAAYDATS